MNILELSQTRFSARKSSADFEAVAIIPVGHIAEDCPHAEKKRKALAEIVEEI